MPDDDGPLHKALDEFKRVAWSEFYRGGWVVLGGLWLLVLALLLFGVWR